MDLIIPLTSTTHCNTFLPTSVRRLNAKSGRGKWSGRKGGYNGAHYI